MRIKSAFIDMLGLALGILCVVVGLAELFSAGLHIQGIAVFVGAAGIFTAIFHNWVQCIFEEVYEGDEEDGQSEGAEV